MCFGMDLREREWYVLGIISRLVLWFKMIRVGYGEDEIGSIW